MRDRACQPEGKRCITLSCQRVILGNDVENETRQSYKKGEKRLLNSAISFGK